MGNPALAPRQHCAGQRERQRKHTVLELDHVERKHECAAGMSEWQSVLILPRHAVIVGWHRAMRKKSASRTMRFLLIAAFGLCLAACSKSDPVRDFSLAEVDDAKRQGGSGRGGDATP